MVSNKSLSIILVATMFIALFGATMSLNRINGVSDFYALTGAWDGPTINSTYGSVNLTITSQLKINFTFDKADFGSGYVVAGEDACVLSTGLTAEDTVGCSSFNAPGDVQGLYLENLGNVYAKLNISNMNYSDSLISGTDPGYAWQWEADGTAAVTCEGTGRHTDLPTESTLQNLTSDNFPGEDGYPQPGKQLCGTFNYSSGNDGINITFKLHIPQNAPARSGLSDTWFAFATAA